MQKLSSVHALSFDALSPIFEFAVKAGQTPDEITKIPLALSQVCGAWRQSALRYAPLWTNILLDVRGDRSLERATEFLSRSRTLPVCVTFDMQGARGELTGLKERVGFLAPYEHRLRALRVQGATTAVPIHCFLQDLDFTFTNLKDFEIAWGKPTTRLARCSPLLSRDEMTKGLRPFYLHLSSHDKFTNLTRFALNAYDNRLDIQLDELLEILGVSPTLQHLELEGLHFDYEDDEFYDADDPDSEKSILQLPHLRFLSLKQCMSGAFLPRINIPATANVVLVANDPFMLDYGDIHASSPTILYALPPHFEELSFIGKTEALDFEIRDSGITLRASQSSGQYLFIEQLPYPDALYNDTIEEMVLLSATSFHHSDLGPVTRIRASNQLSESKRGILRDAEPYEVDDWLSTMSNLEKLEICYFPLKFLKGFSGCKAPRQPPLAAKDVTLTLYPNECGDFEELKAWVKARAEAQLPFEKLEITLDCSAPATLPVDEKFVDSLRSSLAEYVKGVVVQCQ
ncbi:hypothetical protein BDM02DRAFT_3108649 [Thelephora ganbajun]|uniref:Uncharacterized protein n=1 Tax=Thelephora ganbajun TaxID=370292 RepID=A0ACB6ZUK1_THEGA|nr:hypothetical protein BDM02DRAFT_3108649 [Thelephora ganbajun]